MGIYLTSTGERISQYDLDQRIRAAKEIKKQRFFDEHRGHFCERCGTTSESLTMSHNVSIQHCKNESRVELAYDPMNLELLCIPCHRKKDGLALMFEKSNE